MASGRRERPQVEPAPKDPPDFIGTQQEMAYAMREHAVAAHQ